MLYNKVKYVKQIIKEAERGLEMAVKELSPKSVQINARIDSRLKKDGDAVLNSLGLTPTQAIRALWQFASDKADKPEEVLNVLFPSEKKQEKESLDRERQRKRELIEKGSRLCDDVCKKYNFHPVTTSFNQPDDSALKEAAYRDKYHNWEVE